MQAERLEKHLQSLWFRLLNSNAAARILPRSAPQPNFLRQIKQLSHNVVYPTLVDGGTNQ
jgi:hypothetical protein